MKKIFCVFSLGLVFVLIGCTLPTPTTTATPNALPTVSNTLITTSNPTVNPEAFTFASMGDAQDGPDDFLLVTNQIASLNPNIVIFNGDIESDGVTDSEMDPMIAVLKKSGIFNKTFLVRGNHDNHVDGSASLWETKFRTPSNIKVLPDGVSNFEAIDSNSTYLSYSFVYGNSLFIGLDVPGNTDLLTSAELTFLDARLTFAEKIGLVHAFIFWHGPGYCVESQYCDCTAKLDGSCTPDTFIDIVNKHPVVSASFHGHEHIFGWVHMDNTRVPNLTHPYEEFLTSPAGGYLSYVPYILPNRIDYYYPLGTDAMDMGFGTLVVNGYTFTFNIYKVGTNAPVWSKTFTKGSQ